MSRHDLKGLGPNEGAPLSYHWTLPSLMPTLLPWLGVLGLLALRPNRRGQAWWVWLPLALGAGLGFGVTALAEAQSSSDFFGRLVTAGAFGVAAVWLLSFWLDRQPWPLAFLGVLLLQVAASVLTLATDADSESIPAELGLFVFMSLCGLGIALALTLAGWRCRRRFGAARFAFLVFLFLMAGWLLAALPFCVVVLLAGQSGVWAYMLLGAAAIATGSFLVLAPFLVLGFGNAFYRERLTAVFNIPDVSPGPPPPLPAPTAAASAI
jgi:hypothetical protein